MAPGAHATLKYQPNERPEGSDPNVAAAAAVQTVRPVKAATAHDASPEPIKAPAEYATTHRR